MKHIEKTMVASFPRIETPRLILNETTLADTGSVFSLFSDPQVLIYYDIEQFNEPEQAMELINSDAKKYKDGQMLRWAVREKLSSKYIGGCGINRFELSRHTAVIGYEFIQDSWGKGFATESIQAVVDFCFSNHSPHFVNRIEAYVMQGNLASEAILTKLGFDKEGILKQHSYWKGQYHDLALFSKLKCNHHNK